MFLGFLFIFTPIIALIVFSFNVDRFPSLPWAGTTTHWYSVALHDSEVTDAFKNSLFVGVIVGCIATFLGATAAYFLNRWQFRGQGIYLALAILAPTIPLIVLALSFRVFFLETGLFSGSLWAVIVSHVVLASAFAMGIVRMRLTSMDAALEEASWNLGAGPWRSIWAVVIPQIAPALVAAFLIAMAVSWDEFIIAWFVSGFDVTLPVQIYNLLQATISPEINAIGAMVFGITIALVVLAQVSLFVWGRTGGARRGGGSDEVSRSAVDEHLAGHEVPA
jgi:spermidine/putrescine transport system permease protein